MLTKRRKRDIKRYLEAIHRAWCKEYDHKHDDSFYTGGDYWKMDRYTIYYDYRMMILAFRELESNNE